MSAPVASKRNRAGFFSSAKSFSLPLGPRIDPEGVDGYYLDLRIKAETPQWPAAWYLESNHQLYVDVAQWGLGALERHLADEGERWLEAAVAVGELLVREQQPDGRQEGAWVHDFHLRHTFPLPPGWPSAMAQGQAASLLVRLHRLTGEESFAHAARAAMLPLRVNSREGGVLATCDGAPFPEEYPTETPSFVLNGAIFAQWGVRDTAVALGDSALAASFQASVDMLAANIDRWDLGYWSRYDLYPRPVVNPASSFYHELHISQLEAMQLVAPRPELAAARDRFRNYAASRADRYRAFAAKALFRLAVPRNRLLAQRLPWTRHFGR